MCNDWIRWLSSQSLEDLTWMILPFLLLDVPRYALTCGWVWIWLRFGQKGDAAAGGSRLAQEFTPTVCVVIVGYNEAKTIAHTLSSVVDTYPNLQIIVVDDGSQDRMRQIAQQFAARHADIMVLSRAERGGKSSALNFALPFVTTEVVVCFDADSHAEHDTIRKLIPPLQDEGVGAVSGNLLVRNASASFVTALQSLEYRRSIFLGRLAAERWGLLGIVSGAIGAYRTNVLRRLQGWDVGPGEDGDLALRIRRSGWRIAFAPYAHCHTNAPTTWRGLFRQRRRWDWAIVTLECRKHRELASPAIATYHWRNTAFLMDRWMFGLLAPLAFWPWLGWYACIWPIWKLGYMLLLHYFIYLAMDLFLMAILLDLSADRKADRWRMWVLPFMPVYHLFLRLVTTVAIMEEWFLRRSYRDAFVPARVRQVTWQW